MMMLSKIALGLGAVAVLIGLYAMFVLGRENAALPLGMGACVIGLSLVQLRTNRNGSDAR